MTIGQVAKRAGVSVQTLRFYERKGLVTPAGRRSSGYRRYTPDAVGRIRFIKQAQDIGFSLREIKDLLSLRVDPETTCADVRTRAQEKMAEVEDKILKLRHMHQALGVLVARCVGDDPASACPILEALDEVHPVHVDGEHHGHI